MHKEEGMGPCSTRQLLQNMHAGCTAQRAGRQTLCALGLRALFSTVEGNQSMQPRLAGYCEFPLKHEGPILARFWPTHTGSEK